MRMVDTHLHLIYPERLSYPWLDGVPALKRSFTLEDYLAHARPAGIDTSIHMEVDVAESDMEAETDFVTGIGNGVVAAIAACRPESPSFPAYLERAAANPRVKGFRRVLHVQPDEVGQLPIFAENLQRLARLGLSFDFCVLPRQIPIAANLAKRCPDVQFILDHCGVPDVKARELDPWRSHIRAVAVLPNIACKISGIVAYADAPGWTVGDLRPYVEHVIECFGWDRVVWGSDWPVCTLTADLTRWVAATRELIAGASQDEQEQLSSRNAERIYRLT